MESRILEGLTVFGLPGGDSGKVICHDPIKFNASVESKNPPTDPSHLATKQYIDDLLYGLIPPLAVQTLAGESKTLGSNWIIADAVGAIQNSNFTATETKLYKWLKILAFQGGRPETDTLSNGAIIEFRKLDDMRIIVDAANAQLAMEEYGRTGVSWYWCIHIENKVRLPITKHFINHTHDDVYSSTAAGSYSKDQIVDITGNLENGVLFGGGQATIIPVGAFKDTNIYVDPVLGTTNYHRHLANNIMFKASNSPGVNVGQWVQPRATALRLAFYVGFLKQSRHDDLN